MTKIWSEQAGLSSVPPTSLGGMARAAVLVSAETACEVVDRMFMSETDLTSVVVVHPDGPLEMLTRHRFSVQYTGRFGYGRALYGRRPVSRLPGSAPTLILDGTHTVEEAVADAMAREQGRYDDAIVVGGEDIRTVMIADLMSELARLHSHRSLHDPLTRLANRELFHQRLAAVMADSSRPAAVIFVDLDDFKSVNDSMGHPAGDELLRIVGRRLDDAFRSEDTVARFGGDEFAILQTAATHRSATAAAERVALALSVPVLLAGQPVTVGASVGVACSTDAASVDALLRNADLAMYAAKRAGRRHAVYRPSMHEDAVARLELRQDLERAIAQDELRLEYQPIMALASGGIVGVEALLRWEHPTRGLVAPVEFIPLAEETGAIVTIGRWVLREACAQVAKWRRRFAGASQLLLSINVSAQQLELPDFVDDVREALDAHRLEPGDLMLEVTESELIRDTPTCRRLLRELDEMGVRIAIDDFGTGFSSLHRLQQLPIRVLKIDKAFVDELDHGERNGFLRGLVGLADALGMQALAEGIESEHQLEELVGVGCPFGQGYHLARPLTPEKIVALLEVQPAAAQTA